MTPSQAVRLKDDLSYRRLLECVERFKDQGVEVLPAAVEWDAHAQRAVIVATVAGPFEDLADCLVYFHAVESVCTQLTLPVHPRDPH